MDSSAKRRVIPDSLLENLSCKLCYKYLTVSPIGIHSDGGNICGRCLYGNQSSPACLFECKENLYSHPIESFIPLELLGYATYPENLFPCVNRFEGCNKLLSFSNVKDHENTCVFKKFQCPLCQFQGVGSQLVQHFRILHKRYLSSDNQTFMLQLNNDFSEIFLYRSDTVLFLVKVQYIKDISQFIFDTLCLGPSMMTKFGRIKILLTVSFGSISNYDELVLLSDRLEISKNCSFNVTFTFSDFHVVEIKKMLCSYNVIYEE